MKKPTEYEMLNALAEMRERATQTLSLIHNLEADVRAAFCDSPDFRKIATDMLMLRISRMIHALQDFKANQDEFCDAADALYGRRRH